MVGEIDLHAGAAMDLEVIGAFEILTDVLGPAKASVLDSAS